MTKRAGGTSGGFRRPALVALIPLRAQVFSLGIHRADQRDFLDSPPSLDLLFALDGVAYVVKAFELRQAAEIIFRGEAGAGSRIWVHALSVCRRSRFSAAALLLNPGHPEVAESSASPRTPNEGPLQATGEVG